MTMDISNFYLMTPLPRHEFIRIKLNDIPRKSSLSTTSGRKQQKMGVSSEARNVRITTGRLIGERASRETAEQARIPPKQISTRTMEARHTTDTIHVGRQQFRYQVRRRGACKPPQGNPRGTLQANM